MKTSVIAILFLTAAAVYADVPVEITYQGRLREYNQPISGTRTMSFKVFDASTGGSQIWSSGDVSITVSTGVFSYVMRPATVDWRGKDYWIETTISNKILQPREKLTSHAYALHSRTAEDIEKSDGNSIHFSIGSSTYATLSPSGVLGVAGYVTLGTDSSLTASAGSIRWNGSNFQGYDGSTWKLLDVQSLSGGGWSDDGSSKVTLSDTNRNVGIGAATPAAKLHLSALNASTTFMIDSNANSIEEPQLIFRKTRAGTGAILTGDSLGTLKFHGHDGTNVNTVGAAISVVSEGTISNARIPASLVFCTHPDSTGALAEHMRITSSGNVGIGTTSPDYKLHVKDTGRGICIAEGTTDSGYYLRVNGALKGQFATDDSGNQIVLGSIANIPMYFQTNSSNRMTITNDGYVGIGTTSPAQLLNLSANGQLFIQMDNLASTSRLYLGISGFETGAGNLHTYNAYPLILGTNNLERMRIDAVGNVGIGTMNPLTPLHVVGSNTGLMITHNSSNQGRNSILGRWNNGDANDSYVRINASDGTAEGQTTVVDFRGDGTAYFYGTVSGATITDRTPYPKDKQQAYDAVLSMQKLPEGIYDDNNREKQLDHSKLSPFVKAGDGQRDLSASVSAQNEVMKDLISRISELESRIQKLEGK